MKKYEWLDVSKGLGIYLVVCNHIGVIPAQLQKCLQFYMPMFFIAAGYTYVSQISFEKLVMKKIDRLLKPYIFYSVVLYLYNLIMVGLKYREDNLFQAVKGIFYGAYVCQLSRGGVLLCINNAPLWFLLAIFNAYIVYWFETTILQDKCKIKEEILIGGNLILTKLLSYLPVLLPWSLDTIFMSANYMFLGKYLKKKRFNRYIYLLFLILYFFLIDFNGNMNYSTRSWGNSVLLFYICGCIGTIVYFRVCELLSEKSDFLKASALKCCKSSICILSMHLTLNEGLVMLSGKLPFVPGLQHGFVRSIIICIICICGAKMLPSCKYIK